MFARLDFPRFLVCCSGDLSDNESEEKPSVAICGGSICILTGLLEVRSKIGRFDTCNGNAKSARAFPGVTECTV